MVPVDRSRALFDGAATRGAEERPCSRCCRPMGVPKRRARVVGRAGATFVTAGLRLWASARVLVSHRAGPSSRAHIITETIALFDPINPARQSATVPFRNPTVALWREGMGRITR